MYGFRYYFTPLAGVLFTLRSRYWCAIGRQLVLSLRGWAPQIHTGFHVTGATWDTTNAGVQHFAYGAITLCGRTFQTV